MKKPHLPSLNPLFAIKIIAIIILTLTILLLATQIILMYSPPIPQQVRSLDQFRIHLGRSVENFIGSSHSSVESSEKPDPALAKAIEPSFTNVLASSGIGKKSESTGASWGDFDRDGQLDLFIAGGVDGNRLYRQNKGVFTDVTKRSGIKISRSSFAGVFGDYDNDGCPDLYVSNHANQPTSGESDILYRNNCNGSFTNVSLKAGIRDTFHGRGAAWTDYNGDGYLDLYVANQGIERDGTYYSEPNILYKNNGDGTFTDNTLVAGVTGSTTCDQTDKYLPKNLKLSGGPYKLSFQPIWFDYNNDSLPDLFVTTDSGVSPLYKNNGDGTFSDVTKEAGLCRVGTGMGATVGDFNNDGYLDLYVTNTGANFLWRNNGDGTFTDIAPETNLADELSIGWGTGFLDYDNDGNLDLYVVNGSVSGGVSWNPEIGKIKIDRLYHNTGSGNFEEVGALEGLTLNDSKEAAAFADYNGDGFTDVLITGGWTSPNARNSLYRNRGNNNHWLTIKLRGTKSNRDAVGARIVVKTGPTTQIREVISGSSFVSQNSLWQTFGLGSFTKIDSLTVRWPSGKIQTLGSVPTNQTLAIVEP